jgi:tRNA(Arg) A34 adenosine deaminase TadA
MQIALSHARTAATLGEVPVGAVIVDPASREIVAAAHNLTVTQSDPTAHAEMLVIRELCKKLGTSRLPEYDLYVTLEPCPMCAQAISFARLRRLYFGAYDSKGGGVEHGPRIFNQSSCHHTPEIFGGIEEVESGQLLKEFFVSRRA